MAAFSRKGFYMFPDKFQMFIINFARSVSVFDILAQEAPVCICFYTASTLPLPIWNKLHSAVLQIKGYVIFECNLTIPESRQ